MSNSGDEVRTLILATERQAYAFDLSDHFRIAIGRHESNDVVLGARNVSNFHAEILREADGLLLNDLRSTNGTFVNGERVRSKAVGNGDRIQIGSYVLELYVRRKSEGVAAPLRGSGTLDIGSKGNLLSFRAGSEDARKTLPAKDLADMSLADLLMTLGANGRSVLVRVRREGEEAKVYVDRGRVVGAEAGRAHGEKALYRLFTWQGATYEIAALPDRLAPLRPISLPTEVLVREAMLQAERLPALAARLPEWDAPLHLNGDCPLPLNALTEAELEILETVIRRQTIARTLEESPLTDFRVLSLVESLLRKRVVERREAPGGMLEETSVYRPRHG